MNKSDRKTRIEDDAHYEEELEHDDSRIGTVFRWSLTVIVLAALMIGGLLGIRYFLDREVVPEIEQAVIDLDHLLEPIEAPMPPAARFVDVTAEAGIDFVHDNGAFGERLLPETMGGGVAFLDYNNNGHQDLLFVNSDHWSFAPDSESPRPNALSLYENDGDGNFRDVTDQAGLGGLHFYGMGVAAADLDGNGWVDLFVTALGRNRLFRNEQGRFVEITDQAGVAGGEESWSTSAAFFDANNNGHLDLWVVNYVQWSRAIDIEVDYRLTGIGRAYGPPTNFAGTRSYLYINNGDGTFAERGEQAGIARLQGVNGEPTGKGLALVPMDFDGDGHMDVMVANDTVQNFMFRNLGDGTFEEVAAEWGVGFDRNGLATGAMGIDAAHFRNDDRLGIAIGNFSNEMSSLYVSQGDPTQFADQAIAEGIGGPTRTALTFGVFFFDYDLSGRLDYLQANGHVENNINLVQSSQHYRQPGQLFWNCGDECPQTFRAVPATQIGDLARPIVGRGAAYADINGNGRLDVVLTQITGPPLLLRNDTDENNHWLRLRLDGHAPNTGAIGARLKLEAGGISQYRTVMPTRSYLSQVELPVTFGLGKIEAIDRLTIIWPDGRKQVIDELALNQLHRIAQP
jgi:hypothetical protein